MLELAIEIDALILILIGVALGSVLGTEYASWRFGRKVNKAKNLVFTIMGVKGNPNTLNRQQIVEIVSSFFHDVLKQAAAPDLNPGAEEDTEEETESSLLPDADRYTKDQ